MLNPASTLNIQDYIRDTEWVLNRMKNQLKAEKNTHTQSGPIAVDKRVLQSNTQKSDWFSLSNNPTFW